MCSRIQGPDPLHKLSRPKLPADPSIRSCKSYRHLTVCESGHGHLCNSLPLTSWTVCWCQFAEPSVFPFTLQSKVTYLSLQCLSFESRSWRSDIHVLSASLKPIISHKDHAVKSVLAALDAGSKRWLS